MTTKQLTECYFVYLYFCFISLYLFIISGGWGRVNNQIWVISITVKDTRDVCTNIETSDSGK